MLPVTELYRFFFLFQSKSVLINTVQSVESVLIRVVERFAIYKVTKAIFHLHIGWLQHHRLQLQECFVEKQATALFTKRVWCIISLCYNKSAEFLYRLYKLLRYLLLQYIRLESQDYVHGTLCPVRIMWCIDPYWLGLCHWHWASIFITTKVIRIW